MALTLTLRSLLYEDTLRVPLYPMSFWLPSDVNLSSNDRITVVPAQDAKHDSIRIDIMDDYLTISTYNTHPPVRIKFGRQPQSEFAIPRSFSSERTSFVLLEEDSVITSAGEWSFRRDREESQVVYMSASSKQPGEVKEDDSTPQKIETPTQPHGWNMLPPAISPPKIAESPYSAVLDHVTDIHPGENHVHFARENTTEPSDAMEEGADVGIDSAQDYLEAGTELVSNEGVEPAIASSQVSAWRHINTKPEATSAAEQLSKAVSLEPARPAIASIAQEQSEATAMHMEDPLFAQADDLAMTTSPVRTLDEETASETESDTAPSSSHGRSEATKAAEGTAHDITMTDGSHHQQPASESPKAIDQQSVGSVDGTEALKPTLADQGLHTQRLKLQRHDRYDDEEPAESIALDSRTTDANLCHPQAPESSKATEEEPIVSVADANAAQRTSTEHGGRPQRMKRIRLATHDDEGDVHEQSVTLPMTRQASTLAPSPKKARTRGDYSRKGRETKHRLFVSPELPTTTAPSTQPETPSPPQRFPSSSTATIVSQDPSQDAMPTTLHRRSSRSTPTRYKADTPILFCSSAVNLLRKKKVHATFQQLGGTLASGVSDATIYCVADKPLAKTSGLVLAIALGKEVVTEQWLIEMNRRDKFPDPKEYLPSDQEHEAEWRFILDAAIQRGKGGLIHILSAYDVQCTPRLKLELSEKKQYKDFAQIATVLGAKHVRAGWPPAACASENLIVLGAKNDPHAATVSRSGHHLYDKDLITMAALRGKLELDSEEFLMTVVKAEGSD